MLRMAWRALWRSRWVETHGVVVQAVRWLPDSCCDSLRCCLPVLLPFPVVAQAM